MVPIEIESRSSQPFWAVVTSWVSNLYTRLITRTRNMTFRSLFQIRICLLKGSDTPGVFSLVLILIDLHEEVIVDIVIAVYSAMLLGVLLEDLIPVPRTVHLHLGHLLSEVDGRLLHLCNSNPTHAIELRWKFRHSCSQFWVIDAWLTVSSSLHHARNDHCVVRFLLDLL